MSYIDVDENGQIRRVRCKRCRATLQVYARDAQTPPQVRKLPDGTRIHEQAYRLCPTPAYTEVVLEIEEADGRRSLHITPMCRACARVLTNADADDLFRRDIAQWRVEGAQRPDQAAFLAAQAGRRARRIVTEA